MLALSDRTNEKRPLKYLKKIFLFSEFSISIPNYKSLVEMGYSREAALRCLQLANNDINSALEVNAWNEIIIFYFASLC